MLNRSTSRIAKRAVCLGKGRLSPPALKANGKTSEDLNGGRVSKASSEHHRERKERVLCRNKNESDKLVGESRSAGKRLPLARRSCQPVSQSRKETETNSHSTIFLRNLRDDLLIGYSTFRGKRTLLHGEGVESLVYQEKHFEREDKYDGLGLEYVLQAG